MPDGDVRLSNFARTLIELGEADDRVVVLAGDLARYVEVLPFAARFPDRFLNLGVAEANIIGMASGLAKTGFRPIVATYGVFIARRAYDQVAMALTTGPTPVTLVGVLPGITCRFRATHQPVEDMALMGSLPAMAVIDPADDREMTAALTGAVAADHPTFIRALRGDRPDVPGTRPAGASPLDPVEFGDEGSSVGLVSSGLGTDWAMEAAKILRGRGHGVRHLHVPRIKPFDTATVAKFCRRFAHVVTVENHIAHGGLFAAVASVVVQSGMGTRVTPCAIPDEWPPSGTVDFIRGEIGLDAASIAAAAERGL
jgi:transketolase